MTYSTSQPRGLRPKDNMGEFQHGNDGKIASALDSMTLSTKTLSSVCKNSARTQHCRDIHFREPRSLWRLYKEIDAHGLFWLEGGFWLCGYHSALNRLVCNLVLCKGANSSRVAPWRLKEPAAWKLSILVTIWFNVSLAHRNHRNAVTKVLRQWIWARETRGEKKRWRSWQREGESPHITNTKTKLDHKQSIQDSRIPNFPNVPNVQIQFPSNIFSKKKVCYLFSDSWK